MRCWALALLAGVLGIGCERETPSWNWEEGYRWKELASPGRKSSGFRILSARTTGIGTANVVSAQNIVQNRHIMHGSGIAVGDVNADGLPDVYVATLFGPNALYLNRGNWQFVSVEYGPTLDAYRSTGALMADIDGDQDLDILVSVLGAPNAALFNDGSGNFTLQLEALGAYGGGSTTMAMADIDGDHDLDLYVGRYKRLSITDSLPPDDLAWENVVDDRTHAVRPAFAQHYATRVFGTRVMRVELGEEDALFVNDGVGQFAMVPWTQGAFLDEHGTPLTHAPKDWALTAKFYDINRDGYSDLYVCNDFESPDYLWMGQGGGVFQKAPSMALRKTSNATMSVDFADVDRDGDVDIFTTDMLSRQHSRRLRQRNTRIPIPVEIGDLDARPQEMQNALFLNRGDATFQEVAHYANVAASDWSWSTSFVDVDLDGYEDILITTGHVFDVQDEDALELELYRKRMVTSVEEYRALILSFPPQSLPNIAFRNRGDRSFEAIEDGWGFGSQPDIAHGMALGDLDGDGDLDAVVNRLNQPVAVYRNEGSNPRIAVRLKGEGANSQGAGARVLVECPGFPAQEREMTIGGQYLSSSEALLVFAAPEPERGLCRLVTTWMDGRQTIIGKVTAGRLYEIDQTGASRDTHDDRTRTPPLFEVEEALPAIHHYERSHDDFQHQPLLPWRITQRGPSVVLADISSDDRLDVVVGSGRGGTPTMVVQQNQGFQSWADPLEVATSGDVTGMVAVPWSTSEVRIFAAVSNEESSDSESQIAILSARETGINTVGTIAFGVGATGPLALLDVDRDGDLDLFAGAYTVAWFYPEVGESRIYINNDGGMHGADTLSLGHVGLVTGAAAGDLDNDGDSDLVLATEWGPLRIFLNVNGKYVDHTFHFGLQDKTGWWKGVALGDFDADGRLDIVATNWGWNSTFGKPGLKPLRLYHGDVDQSGTVDLIMMQHGPELAGYVPVMGLGELAASIPELRRRWDSHAAFATATVDQILPHGMPFMVASELGSTVLLNRGESFEAIPLPDEVQLSAAAGVSVADFDADGLEDLVLSQNLYPVHSTLVRQDAGRGLLVRGVGAGRFEVISNSGLSAYGDGRAVASGDYNSDGRVDVLIAQNGANVLLYQNVSTRSGLRVRLRGNRGNEWGVGAILRAQYDDDSWGPARLVSAGSGYWAQDSPVQVLGRATEIARILVQWPSGKETVTPLPPGTSQIIITEPD